MRLATIKLNGKEIAGIVTESGILPIAALNAAKGTAWKEEMYELIRAQQVPGLTKWYNEGGRDELETIPGLVPRDQVEYAPLYRNPRRIFGIGLNYAEHAGDIGNAPPQGFPGSFFKMADTLIGPGDEIQLPTLKEAQKTTAEAELGIIMGRDCRDVSQEDWQSAIAGYTTILDIQVPSLTVPVKPGRNLAVIIEVAAMNNRHKKMGYNAALEFTKQINEHFDQAMSAQMQNS